MLVKPISYASEDDIIDAHALVYGRFKVRPLDADEDRWWWSKTMWHMAMWDGKNKPCYSSAWRIPHDGMNLAPYDLELTHIAKLPPHQNVAFDFSQTKCENKTFDAEVEILYQYRISLSADDMIDAISKVPDEVDRQIFNIIQSPPPTIGIVWIKEST